MTQVAQQPDYLDISHSKTHKDNSKEGLDTWKDFKPPERIPKSHPWVSRYSRSAILDHAAGSDLLSTTDREVYGNHDHPIAFRVGNGGAGWTGVIEKLCLKFIEQHGNDIRIGWVVNHSRHTQAAMLADIVQVALTYEPEVEELAVKEGWCRRVAAPAFWDHFIVVGPTANPAAVPVGSSSREALQRIAKQQALFHTRADGSATHEKEQKLWSDADVDVTSASWLQVRASAPYQALEMANNEGAYLLTDRATFLTAKRDSKIPNLTVYVEGESVLLNPCSGLANTKVPDSPNQQLAFAFAEWLNGDEAQSMLRTYGRDWANGMPLFTGAMQQEFWEEERLAGKLL